MKTLRLIIVLIVVVVGAGLGFVYSGLYNVAANEPQSRLVEWILNKTSDRSVERHARGVTAPDLSGADMIRAGLKDYHASCTVCHGGPGLEATEIAQGLNPLAPSLVDAAGELSAGKLFWVTRNGIKMTGMPAFGVTRSDLQVWAIVAFVKQLPSLSPEAYQAQVRALAK